MTTPSPPPAEGAHARWTAYLDAVDGVVTQVAVDLADHQEPAVPDLWPPADPLPPALVGRRDRTLAAVRGITQVTTLARDAVAAELSQLARRHVAHEHSEATLGEAFDVTG